MRVQVKSRIHHLSTSTPPTDTVNPIGAHSTQPRRLQNAMAPLLSSTGLIGATVTVAATTVDDAIWLVPFVGSSSFSFSARVAHAVIFVSTLESLSIASVLVALVVTNGVSSQTDAKEEEIMLGSIAAMLCWSLAAVFFVKKWLKRRRRQRQREEESTTLVTATNEANSRSTTGNDYQSTANTNDNALPDTSSKPLTCSNIGTVVSLTFLGALDEVSYFPALILGNIFTPLQVCLGTLLAAILILILVTCCLVRCQPLLDCLDRIPIYAVIALFATVLTVGVIYDIWLSDY